TIGLLKFTGGVQEIFAVQALPGILFPEIIHEGEHLATSYALPEDALREVGFTKPEVPEMPLGYAGAAPAEAPAEPVSH
ncbi:MAG TPA: hypothetical protein VH375_01625, partial [Rhodanobacteraceae bacterium]